MFFNLGKTGDINVEHSLVKQVQKLSIFNRSQFIFFVYLKSICKERKNDPHI